MNRVPVLLLALTASVAAFAADPRPAIDLGIPVTSANRISYKTARGFGPAGLDLLCWTTTAESGGSFCAMDLATGRVTVHPLNSLEAYPIVFGTDGQVYVGSTTGEVMRWNPVTDAWGPLGKPLFRKPGTTVNHVRSLCEGSDGWLYAGSCYGERARINMRTAVREKLPDIPEEGEWYVSAATALPDGNIAFGYGHKARVFVYDPVAGRDVAQVLPPSWTQDGFCFNVIAGASVFYVTHFPSGRRGAIDVATRAFLGEIPWPAATGDRPWSRWVHSSGYGSAVDFYLEPGTDAVISCDGAQILRFDPTRSPSSVSTPPSGFAPHPELALAMRYEVTTDCRVLEYDTPRLSVVRRIRPEMPRVERTVFSLGLGPDGNIYGGAYQSTLLFRHEPRTHSTLVLGDHHPGWSGETFSYAARHDELIAASYTNGAVVAYKPGLPWECEPGAMVNPRFLGFYGQQLYRPYSSCVTPDGSVWSVGPAGWGSTGGAVGRILFPGDSIAVVPLTDVPHTVLPLNSEALLIATDSVLLWWDVRANREVGRRATGFKPLDMCLMASASPQVALLAEGTRLVLLRLEEAGRWEVQKEIPLPFSCSRVLWTEGRLVVGGSGGFASVDPLSGLVTHHCSTPLGSRWACVAAAGSVYFGAGAHLMRAPLPQQ